MGLSDLLHWAVFLDRDGVINRSIVRNGRPYAPEAVDDFEILPGTVEALLAFKAAGAKLIVVTNQPDVGNGLVPRESIETMNRKLQVDLPVDDIRVCYHVNEDQCACRKPKPGMLHEAAQKFGIDLEQSVMIGDRWSDVEAGAAAGCRTVFIDYGYEEIRPTAPDYIVGSLAEAAPLIVRDFPWNAGNK